MPERTTICLDAMSGDLGPEIVVAAAADALAGHPGVDIVLVGKRQVLAPLVDKHRSLQRRLSIEHAAEVVTMEDSPRDAIRLKKNSSMRLAINLVKDGRAAACVSAGNTGALMATAKFVLKTIPGIDRPAIISEIPAEKGPVFLLDLGANAHCTPEQLFQFAIMGMVVARDVTGIAQPRVALLNIGEESTKGDDTVKEAARLIEDAKAVNYVGFIEGNDIFRCKADVVVTDGFTGNVALKTMEGTAALIGRFMREGFDRSLFSRLQGAISGSVLRSLKARMDPRHYNGATLVGLNGIVIKSHGGADAYAFRRAIDTAIVEVESGLPRHIGQLLESQ